MGSHYDCGIENVNGYMSENGAVDNPELGSKVSGFDDHTPMDRTRSDSTVTDPEACWLNTAVITHFFLPQYAIDIT